MPNITILKVHVDKVKNYEVAEVGYRKADGKAAGMKVLSFLQKDVFEAAKGLKEGDVVDAGFEQNNKGFWQFSYLKPTGDRAETGVNEVSSKPAGRGGNWETSEERQARQGYIIRQSSLERAIEFLVANGNKKFSTTEVLGVAEVFTGYVFGQVAPTTPSTQRGDIE